MASPHVPATWLSGLNTCHVIRRSRDTVVTWPGGLRTCRGQTGPNRCVTCHARTGRLSRAPSVTRQRGRHSSERHHPSHRIDTRPMPAPETNTSGAPRPFFHWAERKEAGGTAKGSLSVRLQSFLDRGSGSPVSQWSTLHRMSVLVKKCHRTSVSDVAVC